MSGFINDAIDAAVEPYKRLLQKFVEDENRYIVLDLWYSGGDGMFCSFCEERVIFDADDEPHEDAMKRLRHKEDCALIRARELVK